MAHAIKVVSIITLYFCLLKKRRCDENPAIRGGYGYIMVKLVGCGSGFVFLKISAAWKFHPKTP
jgi:hypothetical protein